MTGKARDMDAYIRYRSCSSSDAESALRMWLEDHPDAACSLATKLDPDVPINYKALERYLKSINGYDGYTLGQNSGATCNFKDPWFKVTRGLRIDSMSQREFEDWCVDAVSEDHADEIIAGDVKIPAELRKVLDLWGPGGKEYCRRYENGHVKRPASTKTASQNRKSVKPAKASAKKTGSAKAGGKKKLGRNRCPTSEA